MVIILIDHDHWYINMQATFWYYSWTRQTLFYILDLYHHVKYIVTALALAIVDCGNRLCKQLLTKKKKDDWLLSIASSCLSNFFPLVHHIWLAGKQETVESSMEASDNVMLVTFLYLLLQSLFQTQCKVNNIEIKWIRVEKYLHTNVQNLNGMKNHVHAGFMNTRAYCRVIWVGNDYQL